MSYLFIFLIWLLGALVTTFVCCSLGMIIGVGMAAVSSLKTTSHLGLLALYLFFALLYAGMAWGFFALAQLIVAHSELNYKAMIIGAVWPGIFGFQAIPQSVKAVKSRLHPDNA